MGIPGETSGDKANNGGLEETDSPSDSDGCSTLCNIIVKFMLFLTNFIVWLLGAGLLALGIYIQIDESSSSVSFQQALMNLSSLLTNPSIALIIIGAVLFIIGFCGCFGALLEIFLLLVIYAILIGLLILGELALVAYFFAVQDQAYAGFELILRNDINNYYNDISTRDVIDLIQRDIFRCCGIDGPDDWQSNIYFNCSSVALQRCSVPPSCCLIEEGQIINLQCGYRTLDANNTERYLRNIHTVGCVAQARNFVTSNIYVILGSGAGLLVFQLLGVILSASLAVGIRKEKQFARSLKKQSYQMQRVK